MRFPCMQQPFQASLQNIINTPLILAREQNLALRSSRVVSKTPAGA